MDPHPQSYRNTHWHVITGAPCSGKTSVINGLAARGYNVVHETARAYIDSRLAAGQTLAQIKSDPYAFERHILLEKVRIEQRLAEDQTVFLDRAVPDSIAYFEVEGLSTREPMSYSEGTRYARVFLFDRLTFEKDGVRSENTALAARIETLIEKWYTALGYRIVRVPVLPVSQRIEFVLDHSDTGSVTI